jgi:hypothetical protein
MCASSFITIGRANDRSLRNAGFTLGALFLKQQLPPRAYRAFETVRALGAFETIRVLAPKTLFRKVSQLDPIVFGVKDGNTYLIAQFSFGSDLQTQQKTV